MTWSSIIKNSEYGQEIPQSQTADKLFYYVLMNDSKKGMLKADPQISNRLAMILSFCMKEAQLIYFPESEYKRY